MQGQLYISYKSARKQKLYFVTIPSENRALRYSTFIKGGGPCKSLSAHAIKLFRGHINVGKEQNSQSV
jgi:hypothetical protein